jgi:hypothetical protein
MKNADLPAMPTYTGNETSTHNGVIYTKSHIDSTGLTKREHFAAMAMQGILAGNSIRELAEFARENEMDDVGEVIKVMSFRAADLMLAEEDKQ